MMRPANTALMRAVILSAMILVGCGGRSEDETEIQFWAFGSEGENVKALIPGFERTHPGIRVKLQVIPWTAAHEKLLTAYAGESTPDICQLGNTWIPEFVTLKAIEPLDPWIRSGTGIGSTSYFPGIWKTNFIDSVQYGLPWYVDTRVLFYRKDVLAAAGFAAPPRTWAEWDTVCRRIVTSGSTRFCCRPLSGPRR
jgi:multiple sugar transport system substrate-binding protein